MLMAKYGGLKPKKKLIPKVFLELRSYTLVCLPYFWFEFLASETFLSHVKLAAATLIV